MLLLHCGRSLAIGCRSSAALPAVLLSAQKATIFINSVRHWLSTFNVLAGAGQVFSTPLEWYANFLVGKAASPAAISHIFEEEAKTSRTEQRDTPPSFPSEKREKRNIFCPSLLLTEGDFDHSEKANPGTLMTKQGLGRASLSSSDLIQTAHLLFEVFLQSLQVALEVCARLPQDRRRVQQRVPLEAGARRSSLQLLDDDLRGKRPRLLASRLDWHLLMTHHSLNLRTSDNRPRVID